jgi:P27 family predicted phage terminase small subunit
MSKRARETWKNIVDSLPPGFFKRGALPLLRAYCEAEATHYEASKKIATSGLIIKTSSTVKANPAIAIQTAKSGEMAQLSSKLRLSVSSYRDRDVVGRESRETARSKRSGLMFGED